MPAEAPPSVIAERYVIESLLGAGGMGRVYRAHDRTLDETVALKLLRRELLDLPGMLERFRQEVKLARRVTHANVVRTFDLGQHGADHFLTMEFIDGRSLAQLLDEGLLPLPQLLSIARAACAGIAAAHAAGVLHRDLKPDNILVAKTGRIAITDFGIAQVATDPTRPAESFVGTPAYMAPEQVEGTPFGPPGDVYTFGAILFEMITGRRPFIGRDALAVANARLTKPAPDPRDFCALPEALATLIVRCLAREPERRFADGGALAVALDAVSIDGGSARAAAQAPAVPGKTSRAVALLPLRASGDLAEIADGLTEEIIDALSMTRELRVRPLATVRAATTTNAAPEAIGRALGVDVVVDGSVRRRGDEIRIAARAIGAIDGFQLWANHVDTASTGLLAAGDEVARAIARALTVELDMPARIESNAKATELYLESKARLRFGWNKGEIDEALAGFEQAHAIAPDDPAITASLSMALARASFYGAMPLLPRARQLAERAVAQAPASGDAQVALGIASLYASEIADAARAFARAVTLAPGHAYAQALFGAILLEVNALTAAHEHLVAAYAIDPSSPAAPDLARALVYMGQLDEVDREMSRRGDGNAPDVQLIRARFAMWKGETYTLPPALVGTGVKDFARYFEIVEHLHRTRTFRPGDRELIERGMLVFNPRLRATRSQFMAEYLMFTGDPESAVTFVRHAVDAGLVDHCWFERCPLLEPLYGRPDFEAMRATVAGRARMILDAVREVLALPE
jgi:serine/threonine-protein kinase